MLYVKRNRFMLLTFHYGCLFFHVLASSGYMFSMILQSVENGHLCLIPEHQKTAVGLLWLRDKVCEIFIDCLYQQEYSFLFLFIFHHEKSLLLERWISCIYWDCHLALPFIILICCTWFLNVRQLPSWDKSQLVLVWFFGILLYLVR